MSSDPSLQAHIESMSSETEVNPTMTAFRNDETVFDLPTFDMNDYNWFLNDFPELRAPESFQLIQDNGKAAVSAFDDLFPCEHMAHAGL
jgi:hypothetical protein